MRQPNALVLNSAGINCNEETGDAFAYYGANVSQVNMSQLSSGEERLSDYQILVLSGGFSDGDAIQAGRTLGLQLKTELADDINSFIAKGGLAIGICNGFQIMTEAGLLPDGRIDPDRPKKLSLVRNASGLFTDRWVHLSVEKSRCPFAQPEDLGEVIELPVANGESREVASDMDLFVETMRGLGQIVFRFATKDGRPAVSWEDKPSGSQYGITGICDRSGQILGLMPHPERFIDSLQHPNFRRGDGRVAHGGIIIKKMVQVAMEA